MHALCFLLVSKIHWNQLLVYESFLSLICYFHVLDDAVDFFYFTRVLLTVLDKRLMNVVLKFWKPDSDDHLEINWMTFQSYTFGTPLNILPLPIAKVAKRWDTALWLMPLHKPNETTIAVSSWIYISRKTIVAKMTLVLPERCSIIVRIVMSSSLMYSSIFT